MATKYSFNTQPPEGGWNAATTAAIPITRFQHTAARRRLASGEQQNQDLCTKFQHTAARRRLDSNNCIETAESGVSTHSRPKAAGSQQNLMYDGYSVSTHSRPKAAGVEAIPPIVLKAVSTHSRPKAAGRRRLQTITGVGVSTHSRPKAAGLFQECAFLL